jgi:antitoxin (DNA-binding transcriptional repressor) of toxin-antitoxin stability system
MERLKLTVLRRNLFRVVDQVLATGVPVAVDRHGKTVLLLPQDPPSRLARLPRRKLIRGDVASLPDTKVGTWREPRNLK